MLEDSLSCIHAIQDFLNWAEERCDISGSRPQLAKENQPRLICEFIGIDYDALQKEAEEMEKSND